MTRALVILLALWAAGPAAWAQPAATGPDPSRRVALVLGLAAYVEAPRLANAARDAQDVCAALKRLSFEADCRFDLADRAALLGALRDFAARLGPDTHALLYYAGHAVQLQGENFLLPVQARVRSSAAVAAESVRLDEILALLREARSAFSFVVLDACRDDPFDPATARAASAAGAGTTASATRGARANTLVPRGKHDGASTAVFGLGAIRDAPAGSIVLYATGAGEPAFDGRGRNGPLTKHFLEHLELPGLPVEDFIKRVTAGVQADTQASLGRRQTPFVYSSFTGNFCFAGCRAVPLESELEALRRAARELEQDLQRSRERSNPRPAPRVPPAL